MDKKILVQLAKEVYQLSLLFPNKEPLRYRVRESADEIVAGFIIKRNDYIHDLKLQLEALDSYFDIASCQDWTSPARINSIRDRYQEFARALGMAKPFSEQIILPAPAQKETSKSFSEFLPEPEFTPIVPLEPISEGGVICPPPIEELPSIGGYPMVRPESRVIPVGESLVLPDSTKVIAQESVPVPAVVREDKNYDLDLGEDAEDGEESGTGLTSGQILRQNRILTFLKEKGGAQVWEIQKIFPSVSKRTIRRDFRSMLKQGLIERFGERNTTSYKLKINIS